MSIISEIDFIKIPFEAIGKSGTIRTGAGFHSNDFTTSGVPLIKIGNIKNNEIDLSKCDFISDEEKKINLTKEKDVLVAMRGATSGKLGIVDSNSSNCFYVGSIGNLGSLNEELVYEPYLKWLEFQLLEILKTKSKGSAQPMVSIGMLKEFILQIPKTKKQQKLFCELMKIRLEQHEAITSEIDQQQTYLQHLRQTILQEAVQGKLTQQDPTDEPATELLKRIKAEKEKLTKAGKFKKEKELPPITEDEIPFALPDGWVWCRLGELGFITGGGTPSTSNTTYWNGNIPWITPKDMKADFLSDAEDKVTIEGVNNSSAKLIPPNSILIVGRSGILKRTLPVCINTVECVVNQDLKVIIPHVKDMTRYIQIMLQGHKEFILQKLVKYGMTVHSLMFQEFEAQPFPLPPLPEQHRIVTKVQQLQQHLSALEMHVQQSRKYAQLLLQSVLREVFEGKEKVYAGNEYKMSMVAEAGNDIYKQS